MREAMYTRCIRGMRGACSVSSADRPKTERIEAVVNGVPIVLDMFVVWTGQSSHPYSRATGIVGACTGTEAAGVSPWSVLHARQGGRDAGCRARRARRVRRPVHGQGLAGPRDHTHGKLADPAQASSLAQGAHVPLHAVGTGTLAIDGNGTHFTWRAVERDPARLRSAAELIGPIAAGTAGTYR